MAQKVRVVNELDVDSLARAVENRAEPYETRIIPLDRDEDPVVLPHSPAGREVQSSPSWETRGAVGAAPDRLDWTNTGPKATTLEAVFQAGSGEFGDISPADLEDVLTLLESFATTPTRKTGEPTRIVLEQGVKRQPGVIDNFTKNVTETAPNGLPRTAEISMDVRGGL